VELVRFRATLENCYAGVVRWPLDDAISTPSGGESNYGELVLAIEKLKADGGDWDALQALHEAAVAMYSLFDRHWLDAEHSARLDARTHLESSEEWGGDSARLDWRVVMGHLWHPPKPPREELRNVLANLLAPHTATPSTYSHITEPRFLSPETTHTAHPEVTVSPFTPESWVAYGGATSSLLGKLPDGPRSLFRLVTLLAEVRYPYPSSYDPRTGTWPALDPDALAHLVAYDIAQATSDVQSRLGCLKELPSQWPTGGLRATICDRLGTVGQLLAEADARRPITGREPIQAGTPDPSGPCYDEKSRILHYRGQTARRFAPQAKVTEKLAEFQRNLWREPVKVGNQATAVVRGLNSNLQYIEFFVVAGKRDQIDWREATTQTCSTPTAE